MYPTNQIIQNRWSLKKKTTLGRPNSKEAKHQCDGWVPAHRRPSLGLPKPCSCRDSGRFCSAKQRGSFRGSWVHKFVCHAMCIARRRRVPARLRMAESPVLPTFLGSQPPFSDPPPHHPTNPHPVTCWLAFSLLPGQRREHTPAVS